MEKYCKKSRHSAAKWIVGLMISLCMALVLLPETLQAATSYNLWVGGVEVTSDNAASITGTGISGTVSYDANTNTLTLDNAAITGCLGTAYDNPDNIGIYKTGDLKIKLIGSNSVSGQPCNSSSYGIFISSGKLTLEGTGSLTAVAADGEATLATSWSVAIYAARGTVGSDCTIEASCGTAKQGAWTIYGGLTLNDAKVTAAQDKSGNDVSSPEIDNLINYRYMKIEPDNASTSGETYSIALNPTTVYFAQENPGAETVTVTNTGIEATGELAVQLLGSGGQENNFTLSVTSLSSIAPGDTVSFTVTPKPGLSVGRYHEVVVNVTSTVGNMINVSANLDLTIYPQAPDLTGTTLRNAVYTRGATAAPLTMNATVSDGGTLTYQWCTGSTEAPMRVDGATSATFVPPTDTEGTVTYHCDVINTLNGISCGRTSEYVTITVTEGSSASGSGSESNASSGVSVSPNPSTYQIIEGAGSSWMVGSRESCTIRGNGEFSRFTGVKVDGSLIDKGNYTAREGSTIVTLQNSYLKTLPSGVHTVEILWTDGSAATTVTINAKDSVPKTGESATAIWLFALTGLSGMGLLLVEMSGRRNKKIVRKH